MKALIVDREEIYRLSMKEVVSAAADFDEILEAADEHDFISMTANHSSFDLIILQPASMKDGGRNCLQLVRRLYPSAALISIGSTRHNMPVSETRTVTVERAIAVHDMITLLRRTLKLPLDGASAACQKQGAARVRKALRSEFDQFRSEIMINDHDAYKAVDLGRLSRRQQEILAMTADGLPNKEIAARLSIAEGTVKAHMHSIFKVLGVSNRTQAVIRYGACGGHTGAISVKKLKPECATGNWPRQATGTV